MAFELGNGAFPPGARTNSSTTTLGRFRRSDGRFPCPCLCHWIRFRCAVRRSVVFSIICCLTAIGYANVFRLVSGPREPALSTCSQR